MIKNLARRGAYAHILMLVLLILASLPFSLFTPAQAQGVAPERPRVLLDSTYQAPAGATISVRAGQSLQAALDAARPGDTIELENGATFTGNFVMRGRAGSGWIYVQPASLSGLPVAGTRITPAVATLLPKIVSPNAAPALSLPPATTTQLAAARVRFIGIEFTVAPSVTQIHDIIVVGDGARTQRSPDQAPSDIIFDRIYLHGQPLRDSRRGIAFNAVRGQVINSYISDIHFRGFETQGIDPWNTPGPLKIVNNYIEAAGENVMIGGSDSASPEMVPSDIEIRRNHFFKPLNWRTFDPNYVGAHWSVKNLFELKVGIRVLVDGNTFENCWRDGQTGEALVIKVVNQENTAPWSETRDVTITNNIIKGASGGVVFIGADPYNPAPKLKRVLFRNNLLLDIGSPAWNDGVNSWNGRLYQVLGGVDDLTIDHNTAMHSGNVITFDGPPSLNFVFTNNLQKHNEYGVIGSGKGTGAATLAAYAPGGIFTANVLIGGVARLYPAGNYFPATIDSVGFSNLGAGDYSLAPSSPYVGAGTDGRDIGADIRAILEAQRGEQFPTDDHTPPVISNPSVSNINQFGATLSAETNEPASLVVEFGPSPSFGYSTAPAAASNQSSININILAPGMRVFYRLHLADLAGNESTVDGEFTTPDICIRRQ